MMPAEDSQIGGARKESDLIDSLEVGDEGLTNPFAFHQNEKQTISALQNKIKQTIGRNKLMPNKETMRRTSLKAKNTSSLL